MTTYLVDDNIKDATKPLKNNGGILNPTEGNEEAESRIDKPSSLRMPRTEKGTIKDATTIKSAAVPGLGNGGTLNYDEVEAIKDANGGTLNECIHGLPILDAHIGPAVRGGIYEHGQECDCEWCA